MSKPSCCASAGPDLEARGEMSLDATYLTDAHSTDHSLSHLCREKRHVRERQVISFHLRHRQREWPKSPRSRSDSEAGFVSASDRMASLSLSSSPSAFPCRRIPHTEGCLCQSSPQNQEPHTHTSHAHQSRIFHRGRGEIDRRRCVLRTVSCRDSREEYS